MQLILKILVSLAALLFTGLGLKFMIAPGALLDMWGLDPAAAANPQLAWSTARADVGGLLTAFGVFTGLGVLTRNKTWLHAGMLLMSLVFIARAVGLVANGSDPQIYSNMGIEAILVLLMWLYARGLD